MSSLKRISDKDYFNRMDYWDVWANDNGGLEVYSEENGTILYTIGVKHG